MERYRKQVNFTHPGRAGEGAVMKKLIFCLSFLIVLFSAPTLLLPQTFYLDYSTYLGGEGIEWSRKIAVDSAHQPVVVGFTAGNNFPLSDSYQAAYGGGAYDAFVSKFSDQGSSLIFSTYLGGSGLDTADSLVLDSDGCVYLGGYTSSTDYPTLNPYQASFNSGTYDLIISKLSSSGSSLMYSTYLGGGVNEITHGICLNSQNQVCLVGHTISPDFPTVNPYQAAHGGGGDDGFISLLSSSGSNLLYSSYLGGDRKDINFGVGMNSVGEITVTGYTLSDNFPTLNPYQSFRQGIYDIFITRFSSDPSALLFSTYLGGTDSDYGINLELGSADRAYIVGYTESPDYPTRDPYQASFNAGTSDALISLISASGSSLEYSTYLGGAGTDLGGGISLDSLGRVYVSGATGSTDFPTRNPYQAGYGGGTRDGFVCLLTPAGSSLIFSSYLGGSGEDSLSGNYLDGHDRLHLAGYTTSADLPVKNPYQSNLKGAMDALVCRVRWDDPSPTPIPSPTPPYYIIESGDYSGDGRSDISIFRPDNGLWAFQDLGRIYFGAAGDIPISGDYDGDGFSDPGVFRPATGLWAIKHLTRIYYGGAGDIPVPADYDGDGICNPAIFRETTGLWAIRDLTRIYYGQASDLPVPGDYDWDGAAEIAVFRSAVGLWAIRGYNRFYFGAAGDVPVPAEYQIYADFNRRSKWRTKLAVFRPSTGLWAIGGYTRVYFGQSGDLPLKGDFDGDSLADIGIFRSSSGLWAIRGMTRTYFGRNGDLPVSR